MKRAIAECVTDKGVERGAHSFDKDEQCVWCGAPGPRPLTAAEIETHPVFVARLDEMARDRAAQKAELEAVCGNLKKLYMGECPMWRIQLSAESWMEIALKGPVADFGAALQLGAEALALIAAGGTKAAR